MRIIGSGRYLVFTKSIFLEISIRIDFQFPIKSLESFSQTNINWSISYSKLYFCLTVVALNYRFNHFEVASKLSEGKSKTKLETIYKSSEVRK